MVTAAIWLAWLCWFISTAVEGTDDYNRLISKRTGKSYLIFWRWAAIILSVASAILATLAVNHP